MVSRVVDLGRFCFNPIERLGNDNEDKTKEQMMQSFNQYSENEIKKTLFCNFCFSNSLYNKTDIFLTLIEYEMNCLLGDLHLVDYISVHIRFDLERYLLIIVELSTKTLNGLKFYF